MCTLQVVVTVDLFAASLNAKCSKFWIWKDPHAAEAAGQDAFSIPKWSNLGLPHIYPSAGLLGQVLQRINQEPMSVILVLPRWPSQPWPSLFRPFAKTTIEIGRAEEVLNPGPLMTQSEEKKEFPLGMRLVALLTSACKNSDST
jgi:hypothetical protein